jgi:NHS family xanthosine MFS transporter
MGIKNRLTVMSFLQFFVWGAWLITIANYWFGTMVGRNAVWSCFGTMNCFIYANINGDYC